MNPSTWQTASNFLILTGIVAFGLGGFGHYYFGKKVLEKKEGTANIQLRDSPHAVVQNMQDSPGSLQVAGDLNINADRRIKGKHASALTQALKNNPCPITVGALGAGGEPDALANDFLEIAQKAGCRTKGVFHGIGFQSFNGIQVKFSPVQTPTNSVLAIVQVLKDAKLAFDSGPDPSQAPGSIYIYVGYKP